MILSHGYIGSQYILCYGPCMLFELLYHNHNAQVGCAMYFGNCCRFPVGQLVHWGKIFLEINDVNDIWIIPWALHMLHFPFRAMALDGFFFVIILQHPVVISINLETLEVVSFTCYTSVVQYWVVVDNSALLTWFAE